MSVTTLLRNALQRDGTHDFERVRLAVRSAAASFEHSWDFSTARSVDESWCAFFL